MPTLTGGEPMLSDDVLIEKGEGALAGPLAEIARRHPEVSIGSYPRVVNGGFVVNIVARCTDADLLEAAMVELRQLA